MKRAVYVRAVSLVLAALFSACVCSAQGNHVIAGRVVDATGEGVEYVSIGMPRDTVGTISDSLGRFKLTIPFGKTSEVVFEHVSYMPATIGADIYSSSPEDLVVTLCSHELTPAVALPGKGRRKELLRPGMRLADDAFSFTFTAANHLDSLGRFEWKGAEAGSVVRVRHLFRVDSVGFSVRVSGFDEARFSINFYRMEEGVEKAVSALERPLYASARRTDAISPVVIRPEDTVVLSPGRYYVTVKVLDFSPLADGMLSCDLYMKNAVFRDCGFGEYVRLPFSIGLWVCGTEFRP